MSESSITNGSKTLEEIESCLQARLIKKLQTQIADLKRNNKKMNIELTQKIAESKEMRKAYEQLNDSHQGVLKSVTKSMQDVAQIFNWIFKLHPELEDVVLKKIPQIKGNVIL